MPTAKLRVFRCTTGYDSAGELVVDKAQLDEPRSMPIWVPELLEVNALAAPLGRHLTYRLKQHELNIVLSFLNTPPTGCVSARIADLKAAARHIRAFVAESVGMGMLTAAMRDFYCWSGNHDHLEHFDALPINLVGSYQRLGVRPDLLFRDPTEPGRDMAGEARGRTTKPSKRSKPLVAQNQRLNKILDWSARHDYHPATMAWTSLGGESLSVDLFDISFPPPSTRRPDPSEKPAPPGPSARREDTSQSSRPSPSSGSTSDSSASGYHPGESFGRRHIREDGYAADSDDGPDEMRGLGMNSTSAIDYLYETAPPGDRAVAGNPVRGDWVAADLLGESRTQLFLGVLERKPSPTLQSSLRERREAASDSIQVDVFGRLVVALSLDSGFAPPWREVNARIG